MSELTAALPDLLKTVRRPGDFYASGEFDLVGPGIEIDGFGPLALPVLPDQAARLIAAAAPAPFGRGEATIVDPAVRRSWQIAPERVRISGKRWGATLEAVVRRAAEGLGAGAEVEAEFYKLLVYDEGSFFVSHRDTEKSPGMFATLVIALPSPSTGGDLVVRHAGRDAVVAMRGEDPGEACFAAFYADCLHEVRRIDSGCRVTLVYNLVRKGQAPEPPRYEREEDALVRLLDAWREDAAREDRSVPAKVVYPLEHAYTPAELSFASLKGADAAAAKVLAGAAARADCDLHLALLTVEQSGPADYSGGGWSRGRWREPGPDDFEIGEISDESETLTGWRGLNGETPGFGEMPVADNEVSPPDVIEEMVPDEQHFHEATGNEGATIERTYRRAALVIWPTAGFLPMIAAAGLKVSLPYLKDLVERTGIADDGERSGIVETADALAGAMIALWPDERYYSGQSQATSATGLLESLAEVGATDRIRQFLLRHDSAEGRSKADNAAVVAALSALLPGERTEIVEHIVEDGGQGCFAAGADLLHRAASSWPDLAPGALRTAAGRLLALCPRDGMPAVGYPGRRLDKGTVVDLMRALCRIDPGLGDAATDALLASPKTFDMDERLVPAVRDLIADPAVSRATAVETLRRACVAHLEARIALPLAPPADWTRAARLTCACEHCSPLALFLADPARGSWSLKASQGVRSHVEMTIASSHCDVATATVRKGSPHQLAVTKTQASYDRRSRQRREDLDILARLGTAR